MHKQEELGVLLVVGCKKNPKHGFAGLHPLPPPLNNGKNITCWDLQMMINDADLITEGESECAVDAANSS